MFPVEEESAVDGLIVEEGEESASEEDEQGMFEHFRLNVDKGPRTACDKERLRKGQ